MAANSEANSDTEVCACFLRTDSMIKIVCVCVTYCSLCFPNLPM